MRFSESVTTVKGTVEIYQQWDYNGTNVEPGKVLNTLGCLIGG